MTRLVLGWVGVALAISWAAAGRLGADQERSIPTAPSVSSHRALVNRYCATCHNQRVATASLKLDTMDVDSIRSADAEVWEKVVRKVRAGQMPPAGAPRPEHEAVESFLGYLESALDRAAADNPDPGRPAAFHRLNRAEYANAIRDLLAVEIDGASLLPVDDAGHGFDNVADMLAISPVWFESYLSAVGKVVRLAIGDRATGPMTETYNVSRRLVQDDRVSEDLPLGTRGGIALRVAFPLDGEYVVKVRLQRNKDNYIIGLGEPHQLDVRMDGVLVERFSVGGEHKGRSGVMNTFSESGYWGDPEQQKYEFSADAALEVRLPAKAGPRLIAVAFLKEGMEPESERLPPQSYSERIASGYKGGIPAVDSVAISGPYQATGLGDTPSRRKIFVCNPVERSDEESCAKETLSTLARRAYRRPVAEDEVEKLLGFYRAGRDQGGFEAGIGTALKRILVAPDFLFRRERDPMNVEPGTAYRISDLELASRLSFFLWSSIPDDELLGAAEEGSLKDPAILKQQVRRMLLDSRSSALVKNFAGQWLSLRELETISPDPKVSPEFDDNLRDALRQETELFFESLLREDRSVLNLLDADYTFLNERLSRHYGVPDVFGSHFRRVSLGDDRRRGLMGQASVLTVTSYANRTAPTLRGAWILDTLLGTPPPPPPANVPSLKEEDRGADARPLTMRQRMGQHSVDATCATCHKLMDPLGFALENFDSLGKWRETYEGTPIDPSGTLPDGNRFQGPSGLRGVLLSHPRQFVGTFTEKLLTYALGRGVELRDAPVVRKIVREAAVSDYRLTSLIEGIVKSSAFQMRRSGAS